MFDHPQDLGDHVARSLDQHPVADLQSEAIDLVEVVQGCARDRDSADPDRFQVRARGNRTGSANLDIHVLDERFGLLGERLGGNCPAGRLGGSAQPLLDRGRIDLEDQAVDFVFQRLTPVHPAIAEFAQSPQSFQALAMRVDLEPQRRHQFQALPVRFPPRPAVNQQGVAVAVQAAPRGDSRVQHAQRPGGGIARIGENVPAFGGLALVERRERRFGHYHFAAHLEAGIEPGVG